MAHTNDDHIDRLTASGWEVAPTVTAVKGDETLTGTAAEVLDKIETREREAEALEAQAAERVRSSQHAEIDRLLDRLRRVGQRYVLAFESQKSLFDRAKKLSDEGKAHFDRREDDAWRRCSEEAKRLRKQGLVKMDQATELLTASTKILEQLADLPAEALRSHERLLRFAKQAREAYATDGS